jgi:hypothetical protein
MGVTGLWKHLEEAGQAASVEQVALKIFDDAQRELVQGRPLDANRLLGLRVSPSAGVASWRTKE